MRTTFLYVRTPCSTSPHASPSWFEYGPTPLFGSPVPFSTSGGISASCSQEPSRASLPSSEMKKPMS